MDLQAIAKQNLFQLQRQDNPLIFDDFQVNSAQTSESKLQFLNSVTETKIMKKSNILSKRCNEREKLKGILNRIQTIQGGEISSNTGRKPQRKILFSSAQVLTEDKRNISMARQENKIKRKQTFSAKSSSNKDKTLKITVIGKQNLHYSYNRDLKIRQACSIHSNKERVRRLLNKKLAQRENLTNNNLRKSAEPSRKASLNFSKFFNKKNGESCKSIPPGLIHFLY